MTKDRLDTVVIGKIHISEWAKTEFDNRLIELLSKKQKYKRTRGKGARGFFWTFSNYTKETIGDNTVIFAKLVKVKEQINEIVFDEPSWEPTRVARNSPNAISSKFIIIPDMRVIIFEELQPISINLFKEMFATMYEQQFSSMDLSKVWINLVVEKAQIFQKLKEFDKIIKVRIDVTPSNPDTGDYRKLDDELKESNTDHATLEFNNDGQGLEVENTIIAQAISLALAGYGSQKIIAEKRGKREIISSKDEIVRWKVLHTEIPKDFMAGLTQRYVDFIHRGGTS